MTQDYAIASPKGNYSCDDCGARFSIKRDAFTELDARRELQRKLSVDHVNGCQHQELAELAGTTIFTVSRELAKLQRQGILETHRGRILVSHLEKLSES